jgi:butyrate kinase
MSGDQQKGSLSSVLVINPGSMSTKIGVFSHAEKGWTGTLEHPQEELDRFERILEQLDWRERAILGFLEAEGHEAADLGAVAGRGGLLRPVSGGTYRVTDAMCEDLEKATYGEHASNLGPLLARRFSKRYGVPCFVVDPVTTDEFDPASRLSGVPGIARRSRNHTLNVKAVARRVAQRLGKDLRDTQLVVAHLGGGISICALRSGRIVDSTDALLGEGPFSAKRAGTVPLAGMIGICCDGTRTRSDIVRLLSRESGLRGYLGTGRLPKAYEMIDQGDAQARRVLDAMLLQIAKWIGAMAAVLMSRPDGIVLTGGMANSDRFVEEIHTRIAPLAPLHVFPGSLEMEALAEGAFRVLSGQEEALTY